MNNLSNKEPFWMVWNFGGGAPRVLHPSEQAARNEATRLALANRGQTFIVLSSVEAIASESVTVTDLRAKRYDEAPF